MHSLKQLSAKLSLETYVLAQLYGIRLGFCGTYQFSSGYHFWPVELHVHTRTLRESGMLNNDIVLLRTEQEGLPEQDNHVTLNGASFRNSLTPTAICN